MPEVAQERTHWRDLKLSERHRLWGWDCPGIDIDFLFLEYDKGKAVALVEYKHEHAKPQERKHPSIMAMVDLGDRAGVPVFGVRYADDFSWWTITSLNVSARELVPEQTTITEKEWVTLLYKMRGYDLPENLFDNPKVFI